MQQLTYDNYLDDDLFLWYSGNFSDELTHYLIEMIESESQEKSLGKSKKRIAFLMAESYQNVIRHGSKDDLSIPMGSFSIRNRLGQFHIFSGNQIANENFDGIKSKLTSINGLNQDELRDYYRSLLLNGSFSNKGGAGLGLIEMARKSKNPLQHQFVELNHKINFYLQIDKNIEIDDIKASNIHINESIKFDAELKKNGTLLLFSGNFDAAVTNSMVKLMMKDLKSEIHDNTKKKMILTGVELLQNISRHGHIIKGVNHGLFSLANKDDYLTLTTVNYILTEKVGNLKTQIEQINTLSNKGLSELYKLRLKESLKNENSNAGVGLIDIQKALDEPLEYEFKETNGLVQCVITGKIKI